MKACITQTGDFAREAEVSPIAVLPGSYRLQFTSLLASARLPGARQCNFDLVLEKHDLETLRDLLAAAL